MDNTPKLYSFNELDEDAKCNAWNNWKFDYYVNLAREENEGVLKFFEKLMDIRVTHYDWHGCELDFDFSFNDESVEELRGEQLRKHLKPIVEELDKNDWYECEYQMYGEILRELRNYIDGEGNKSLTFFFLVNLCLGTFFDAWIEDEEKDSGYNSFEDNYADNYRYSVGGYIIEEKTK